MNKIQQSKILHFGVGNFHRSHQQFYTQHTMQLTNDYSWGIVGVGIMKDDKYLYETLKSNKYSYTLMTRDDNSSNIETIQTLTNYIYAYQNQQDLWDKALDDDLAIISMTVTEGGYNIDKHTGEFDFNEPSIVNDLDKTNKPKTIFGYLAECLRQRRLANKKGVTLLSCDNVQHNGDVLRKTLLAFLEKQDKYTAAWTIKNCSFPNSMVDRITPKTSIKDIEQLKNEFSVIDNGLVVCEPFIQWVIEDKFVAGRPAWEKSGAQFVNDVTPYEKMKLRILNSTHQALCYLGVLIDYNFVHEAAKDKLFSEFLLNYMTNEVEPTLDAVPGININEYKKLVISRFSNTKVKDTLARICEFTSDRIPTFNMPIVWDNLKMDGNNYEASSLILASWAIFLNGKTELGASYKIVDEQKETMLDLAAKAKQSPKEFLNNQKLFGDVINNKLFVESFTKHYYSLNNNGVKQTLINLNTK